MGSSQSIATADATINAPIGPVWNIMTNASDYDNWNPFVVHVECTPAENCQVPVVDTKLKFNVVFPKKQLVQKTCTEHVVTEHTPPTKIDGKMTAIWKYDYTGFFPALGAVKASRIQKLAEEGDGVVSYFTEEVYEGWLVWLTSKVTDPQSGFHVQGEALKARAEELN